jgi:hypothetical protein
LGGDDAERNEMRDIPLFESNIREFVAQKVALYASQHLAEVPAISHNAESTVRYEQAAEGMVMLMKSWCLAGRIPTTTQYQIVDYPDSCWQMFKEKYMPQWFNRKFPVHKKTISVEHTTNHYFVCPHIVTDKRDDHVRFMAIGSGLYTGGR